MSDQTLIQVEGFEETLKKIDFLDSFQINDQYLVPALKKIGGAVRKNERPRVPVFKGSTQKSISNSVTTNGIGSVTAKIGSKRRYYILRFLEQGAKWGSGKTQPPSSRLVEWVKQKLGASDENALQVAFAVARSIGKLGLKAKPVVAPTLAAVRNMVITEVKKAIDKMLTELGKHG